jgi:ABC-type proline/glycine betaine transport system substrate-binding protein
MKRRTLLTGAVAGAAATLAAPAIARAPKIDRSVDIESPPWPDNPLFH